MFFSHCIYFVNYFLFSAVFVLCSFHFSFPLIVQPLAKNFTNYHSFDESPFLFVFTL